MLKKAIFLSSCALLVSACASHTLNVDTAPTGAKVWFAGGTNSYTTPAVFYPDPNSRHPTTKCIWLPKIYAQWQSGATAASQDTLQLCGEGNAWTLILKHPSGHPGLQTDLMVEQRILLERQFRAGRGAAAMAAGFESLGRGLGCLAGGGRCSSSRYYSPPARTAKPVRTYQGGKRSGDDPPVPDLDLDLDLVLPGQKPTRNRCPVTSPYYLTPSCRGE